MGCRRLRVKWLVSQPAVGMIDGVFLSRSILRVIVSLSSAKLAASTFA